MKCAWCGQELKFVEWNERVGSVFTCSCLIVRGRHLAVPQLGSKLYEEVMADQARPDWKPILEQKRLDKAAQ
jgi:hypothetical protein